MFVGGFSNIEAYMCSPKFWEELGKVRGWEKKINQMEVSYAEKAKGGTFWHPHVDITPERYFAMKWFETRISGQSEEQFWQNLP